MKSLSVKGDMGDVVMLYSEGKAFEVEFVTLAGDTMISDFFAPRFFSPFDPSLFSCRV